MNGTMRGERVGTAAGASPRSSGGRRPGRRPRAPSALVPVLAAVLALTACHRPVPDEGSPAQGSEAGAEAIAERVQGCWELRPEPDAAAADTTRRWLEARALPRVVGLDTARMDREGSDSLYRAWSYQGSRKQSRQFSAWRPVGADSIRVENPGALAGTVLRLAVEPERLRGTATIFTDAVGPGESGRRDAPVEARPRDCPG